MNWVLFANLFIAVVIVSTIWYVIKINRGNGHSEQFDDDDVPWEK